MIRLHIKKGLLGEDGVETVAFEHREGLTPRLLLDTFSRFLPQSLPVDVAVAGRQVQGEEMDRELPDGIDVILLPRTTFGLDLVAVLVYAVVMAAISFAVNYLMNTLSPRPKPPGVPSERGDSTSAAYAWDGIQTNYGQGFPVPWVYGRHAVGGQVIYTDLFASTAGGTIDDRLRMVIAFCEGPIARIGDVVAAELDELGGLTGTGTPGPSIPDHIRLNGNLLQNAAVGEPVLNVTLSVWASNTPTGAGDVLVAYNGPTQVGRVQVVAARNAQKTDLDCIVLEGTVSVGNRLEYQVVNPFGTATVATASTVTRVNTTPGVRAWLRPGTLDQRALPANPFRGASTTFSPNVQLNEANEEAVYTYEGTEEITTIGFVVAFPGGLYGLDPQGNPMAYPVVFEFAWRPQGTQAWRLFYRPQTNGQPLRSRTVGTTPRVGPVLDSWGADLSPPGSLPVTGPLEVRLVRRSPSGGSNAVSSGYWRNVFFNTAHVFSYPRVALMGLELAAGARFNGGLPNVVTRIDGALVRVWDSVAGFSPRTWDAFTSGPWAHSARPPGRNPAWCLLDFLTAPWGLGRWLTDDDLDLPAFRRWAAFCDDDPAPGDPWFEAAFQVDLVGDAPRPAWEWVLAFCAAGRASPIVRNGKISVVYQYAHAHADLVLSIPAKAPVQLLTSSTVEKVQVTWLPKAQRPTVYLFQFLNETSNYAQDVLPVEDSEGSLNDPAALGKDQWRPETVQAFGVTRPSQLFREGLWRHRVNRLIRRELSFVAGRWALAAEVGDVIEFEHEILRPFDGDVPTDVVVRVGGTGVSTITVDQAVPATTAVIVRDPDGKPQLRAVSLATVVGSTTVLDLATPVTVAAGATGVVGLTGKLTEPYEIVSITLQKDLKREVRAVQWVPEVHDPITPSQYAAGGIEDGVDVEPDLLAQPSLDDEPEVLDVSVLPERDGGHVISWSRPPNRSSATARVYVRVATTEGWTFVGETAAPAIGYDGFSPGVPYSVSVCLENAAGQHPLPDSGVLVEFTAAEFPPFSPPAVTNARAVALDDFVLVQWDDLDVRDLEHYEVRWGTDWAAGRVLHRSRAARALLGNPPGGGSVLVAARSSSGLYGNPVLLSLPTWTPRNTASVLSEDDLAPSPAGTHTNTQFTGGYLTLAAGALSGTYESMAQDVGYQAPLYWQVRIDATEIENAPLDDLAVEVGSGEARWRTLNGRPASPGAPGIDWQTTVDALAMPIDDVRPSLLVHGHVGEVGSHVRVLVETRFEVGGVWTAYSEHQDRTVVARKVQVRVTLNRESTRYEPRVTSLVYSAHL